MDYAILIMIAGTGWLLIMFGPSRPPARLQAVAGAGAFPELR